LRSGAPFPQDACVTTAPETRYALTSEGLHIAYQVVGDGPVDLVWVMGWASNIEAMWEEPGLARFMTKLASFSRLILFDKRGVGLSDRVPPDDLPGLETRMDDVRAVMDAVESERAVVFGVSEGGPMACLFAATYPDRTVALIVYGTDPDYTTRPGKDLTSAETEEYLAYIDRHWGTVEHAREEVRSWAAPSHADDERLVTWLASYLRRAASPGAAIALARMNRQINVTEALGSIHVPTLVMAKTDDRDFDVARVRAMADRIAGARFVEYPGDEHFFWVGDYDPMLADIERFVADVQGREAELDRVLATVLFTDIVDSTAQAAAIGDVAWRQTRERHDALVRAQLGRFRGREIKTMGDGFLATFEGPARAVRCAEAIVKGVGALGIEVRAGVHTGEVALDGGDVAGLGVAIGARVGALAGPNQVLVSQTVKDLVAGSGLTFEDAGEYELKGVPDRWRLYRVVN
jgi:pimeloyl-ACP methyl ester carboxylesterase